ncbi:hypothetical protein NPIL_93231 [Nephila pilipes]|uniref:Uncharacterized protein n=1 Tax=Nephila pilipes TaxID=299642 RepID=A0A8X6QM04_NEPPI|nr:hypothetical protein NPIL_93231 [Nephila pilipes]
MPHLTKILSDLFHPSQANFSNVCVYSKEPSKFKPKCFLCPDAAYEAIINYPRHGPTRGALFGRSRRHIPSFPESTTNNTLIGVKLFIKPNERLESYRIDLFRSYPKQKEMGNYKQNLENEEDLSGSTYKKFLNI